MAEALVSPHWQAVGLVINQNARDSLAKRYGLVNEVISWFKAIDLFREAEGERMIDREPSADDRRYHKTWLASLIAEGERLVTEIQRNRGLGENPARIKSSDVEAAVEALRITEAEWYGELTEARKSELWEGVFHGQKPGT